MGRDAWFMVSCYHIRSISLSLSICAYLCMCVPLQCTCVSFITRATYWSRALHRRCELCHKLKFDDELDKAIHGALLSLQILDDLRELARQPCSTSEAPRSLADCVFQQVRPVKRPLPRVTSAVRATQTISISLINSCLVAM